MNRWHRQTLLLVVTIILLEGTLRICRRIPEMRRYNFSLKIENNWKIYHFRMVTLFYIGFTENFVSVEILNYNVSVSWGKPSDTLAGGNG